MSFGKRLRNLRENKGLTQEELGKIINQKKSNISKYENERLQPSMETINSFAEYFNVSIDYLFGRTDDPTPPPGCNARGGSRLSIFFHYTS